jgi:predicted RNase H-like HicB family nuclease
MKYTMIIEKGKNNYSAYLPDMPGCVTTGKTIEEIKERMREAIEMHIEGLLEDGLPIPEPNSQIEYIEVEKIAA